MNLNSLPALIGVISLIGFLVIAGYNGYLAWFRPERYRERAVKMVKDWWPFANYFRKHYGSSRYLWAARIMSVTIILIFLLFTVLYFLGIIGVFP
jgi:hypothetical protein